MKAEVPVSTRRGSVLAAVLLFGATLLVLVTPASAPAADATIVDSCGTVDDGGPGTSLADAIAAGVAISFDCPDPVIIVTYPLQIASDVRLDGSNAGRPIVLVDRSTVLLASGKRRPAPVVEVEAGGSFWARNLTILGDGAGSLGTGIVVWPGGALLADGLAFRELGLAVNALGPVRLRSSEFRDNRVGVLMAQAQGDARVETSRFVENEIGVQGGGIALQPGYERVVDGVIFDGNGVAVAGCGYAGTCQDATYLSVANSLIRRSGAGHAAVEGGQVALVNSTVMDNLGAGVSDATGAPSSLLNTIVARNGDVNCATTIGSAVASLQWPGTSCGTSITVAFPALTALYEPPVGSPAYGAGDRLACVLQPVSGLDLFGQTRPRGDSCSIGAVEGQLNTPPVMPPTPRE